MKFGIHNSSWLFGPDPYQAFEATKEKAQWAEAHGYSWFSVMDHLIQIPIVGAPEEPFMEAWTVLSALAAVTQRIRLATLVSSVAYRNPAHLAKIAATVDVISKGRMTLGIGGGWFEDEYRQYGFAFPPRPAERIAQMEEAVRLIRTMWREKSATFTGKYFRIEKAILEPKPVQKPLPPIMIGGSGEKITLRAVARLGDACNVVGDPAAVKHKFDVLRRHCDAEKRDFNEIERTVVGGVLIAKDDAALKAKVRRLNAPDPGMTVTMAIDLIGKYQDVGVQLYICSAFKNDAETHALIAQEVMPHFK